MENDALAGRKAADHVWKVDGEGKYSRLLGTNKGLANPEYLEAVNAWRSTAYNTTHVRLYSRLEEFFSGRVFNKPILLLHCILTQKILRNLACS